jgi:hypothetical protein
MANLYCNHSTKADREYERVTSQFSQATWDGSVEQMVSMVAVGSVKIGLREWSQASL